LDWLDTPENEEVAWAAEKVARAAGAAARAAARTARTAARAAWAARAVDAALAAYWAATEAAEAAYWAAQALDTTETELKFEFVSTLTDEQLSTIDPEWIEYATVEIFER
jgi:hypothetical protein